MKVVLVCAAIAAVATSQAEAFDAALGNAYAADFALAMEAKARCSGVAVNEPRLDALWAAAKGTDAQTPWLRRQFADLKPDLQREIAKEGTAEWCAAAWRTFGPRGIGILDRAD